MSMRIMTDPAWIESMQEELLQFKRLDVWVLVPPSDNIKPLTLKWLFKNKHDEENTVIRNKTRLVYVDDIIFASTHPRLSQLRNTSRKFKRIFRYLRGTVNTGLWYTKDSGFELTGFSNADYAGCKDTFKSTSGGAQFLGEKLVSRTFIWERSSDVITGLRSYSTRRAHAVQQGLSRSDRLESLTTFQLKKRKGYKGLNSCNNILLLCISTLWECHVSTHQSLYDAKEHLGKCEVDSGGSELTKDDKESQLYDEFEHFCQNKGETIQGYYVRASSNARIKLWFKTDESCSSRCPWKITMRDLIKDDHFRETIARGILVCSGKGRRPKTTSRFRLLQDKMLLNAKQESGAILEWKKVVGFLQGNRLPTLMMMWMIHPRMIWHSMWTIFLKLMNVMHSTLMLWGPLTDMFMANRTSEDPIYDEAGPSYDSNNPFEVQDHDAFVDHMDEYHEVHEIQNDVQHNYVGVQSRLTNKPDMVMNDSVTSELARYKELVGEYEKRAKFELTDRERKIDEQT
ncbi:hypothetical protein Tco_0394841 [Tanacetum coccineum]